MGGGGTILSMIKQIRYNRELQTHRRKSTRNMVDKINKIVYDRKSYNRSWSREISIVERKEIDSEIQKSIRKDQVRTLKVMVVIILVVGYILFLYFSN